MVISHEPLPITDLYKPSVRELLKGVEGALCRVGDEEIDLWSEKRGLGGQVCRRMEMVQSVRTTRPGFPLPAGGTIKTGPNFFAESLEQISFVKAKLCEMLSLDLEPVGSL